MSAEGIARMYDHFLPPERLTLLLEAMARGDEREAERLRRSCPRKTYSQMDAEFEERLSLAFDTMAVACIDLRCVWGKVHILEWAVEAVGHYSALHPITAEMAFLDGAGYAKGLRQMPFFSKELPGAKAGDGEGAEDAEADDTAGHDGGDDVGDDGPGLPEAGEGFADRMEAVERRVERGTDCVLAVLRRAADDIAQQLVDAWEAFGRFSRGRLGVSPEVLLGAWGFPVTGDLQAMIEKYASVKPNPAVVDELFDCVVRQWDQRFGPGREEEHAR